MRALTIIIIFISLNVSGQGHTELQQKDTTKKTMTHEQYIATGKTPHLITHNGYSMSFWGSNGQIASEGLEVDAQKNGIWIEYYESGKIKSMISYWHGQEDGIKKLLYKNGNVQLEGYHFRKEKPRYREEWEYDELLQDSIGVIYLLNPEIYKHGTWNEYNEQGKLIKRTTYHMGEIQEMKEY